MTVGDILTARLEIASCCSTHDPSETKQTPGSPKPGFPRAQVPQIATVLYVKVVMIVRMMNI